MGDTKNGAASTVKPAAARKRTRQRTDASIKYLIADSKGEFVVEIPASWRVTFGWVNPSAAKGGYHNDGHCVRIWEGEKLRAVFDGVYRLRDLSIPLARKVSRETGSAQWTHDSSGSFTESREVAVEAEFRLERSTDTLDSDPAF